MKGFGTLRTRVEGVLTCLWLLSTFTVAAAGPVAVIAAGPVVALAFAPDGSVLAAAIDRQVGFISPSTHERQHTADCGSERVCALAFQPRGPLLAVGTGTPGERGGLRLFDWQRRAWLAQLSTNTDLITGVDFSPDGTLLAACSADRSATIYRVESGGTRLTGAVALRGHSGPVRAIAFSPDGAMVVTASLDRSLKVWSAQDGHLLRSLGHHTEAVQALVFRSTNADGTGKPPLCASGSDDRTVRVWQPGIGRMVRIVRGHQGSILALAFSPDGRFLFSAGSEGLVRRIDADSDAILDTWQASPDWIYSLAMSPDGRTLVAGDWRGQILWHGQ